MKTLYVYCSNHIDPTWLRCSDDYSYDPDGSVVRSHLETEEALLNRWTDLMASSDCRYSIEQTHTIRNYLRRNPDRFNPFARWIREGRICIQGGGEAVIDYNLVAGESIVRNHLYSILWCEATFGVRPSIASAPDTFGLSAQMPQLLSQLGYDVLGSFFRILGGWASECFEPAYMRRMPPKPFWRGLDGTVLNVRGDGSDGFGHMGFPIPGRYEKTCTRCRGEGCAFCGQTGLDMSEMDGTAMLQTAFAKMAALGNDRIVLAVSSEEMRVHPSFARDLARFGEEYGMAIRYTTFDEHVNAMRRRAVERMHAGQLSEEDIDERAEGNPVATGCYVTRYRLKRQNREIEDLLLSGEKCAAFAHTLGGPYRARQIERLWNQMAFTQFHDSLPGSHQPAPYEELLDVYRRVRLAGWQVYREALQSIESRVAVTERPGWQPVLVFNPLSRQRADFPVTFHVTEPLTEEFRQVVVEDAAGRALPVVSLDSVGYKSERAYRITVTSADLPPLGYAVLYCRFSAEAPPVLPAVQNTIENEFYRVTIAGGAVSSIHDKQLGADVAVEGAGEIMIEEDIGGLWETLKRPAFCFPLASVSQCTHAIAVTPTCQRFTLRGTYDPALDTTPYDTPWKMDILLRDRNQGNFDHTMTRCAIRRLSWQQEITLLPGIRQVYFRTTVDWDTDNLRLLARTPLGFTTPDDEAYYEIPYGTLKRPGYEGRFEGQNLTADGNWPALNFVGCHDRPRDLFVAVLNKGLAANRVRDGVIMTSLVRSPQFTFREAPDRRKRLATSDAGLHVFEYALCSSRGDFARSGVVHKGLAYNTTFMAVPATPKVDGLPQRHSFMDVEHPQLVISCVKRAEKSDDLVVRLYDAYGQGGAGRLVGPAATGSLVETDLLEQAMRPVADTLPFRAFEVKSVKVTKRNS